MKFNYTNLETCDTATGLVVVIDVLRAFSTAAYAFSAGAESITLTSGVSEGLELRQRIPGALVMGEVGGLPPEGFDFGNSPTEIVAQDLRGKHLIQRTGAGTQGVVRSANAEILFAASFVVAEATIRAIRHITPPQVTFVITGGDEGDEDLACAEYLEAKLKGRHIEIEHYLDRVRHSGEARKDAMKVPTFVSDLDYCMRLDAFNFAMPITRKNELPVMHMST